MSVAAAAAADITVAKGSLRPAAPLPPARPSSPPFFVC